MSTKTLSVKQVIDKALKDAGFTGEFHGNFFVSYPTPPLAFPYDVELRYYTQTANVNGVVHDEGQGNGYYFEIEPENFRLKSEEKLLKVVERFKKFDLYPAMREAVAKTEK